MVVKNKDVIKYLENKNPEGIFAIKDHRYENTYLSPKFKEDEFCETPEGSVYFLSETNLEELQSKYQTDVFDFVSIVIAE